MFFLSMLSSVQLLPLSKTCKYACWVLFIVPRYESVSMMPWIGSPSVVCLVPNVTRIGSGSSATLTRIKWFMNVNE